MTEATNKYRISDYRMLVTNEMTHVYWHNFKNIVNWVRKFQSKPCLHIHLKVLDRYDTSW